MKKFSLLAGIIGLLIGLYLFIHPFTTTAMIGWMLALLVFFTGLTSLLSYFSNTTGQRSIWYLIQGIFSLVFGFIILTSSAMAISSTVIVITSYWILLSGIFRLIAGLQMRKSGFVEANQLLISASIAILLGIFLLFNPVLSAIFIGRLVGLLLIAIGISGIIFSVRL